MRRKSIADESLIEEATKYSLSKPHYFLSFKGWGSPSSFLGGEGNGGC